MRKTIRTMILLGASGAALMTPALAAGRDQRDFGSAYQTDNRSKYGSTYRQVDIRTQPEIRRVDNGRDRVRNVRVQDERYRHERDAWRYRVERNDCR